MLLLARSRVLFITCETTYEMLVHDTGDPFAVNVGVLAEHAH